MSARPTVFCAWCLATGLLGFSSAASSSPMELDLHAHRLQQGVRFLKVVRPLPAITMGCGYACDTTHRSAVCCSWVIALQVGWKAACSGSAIV